MDPQIQALVQKIHDHPAQVATAVAGAGTQALAWLFGVPGASRTMLEARVPYSQPAFDRFIGKDPPKYVAAVTGRRLAGNALRRAHSLKEAAGSDAPVFGVGATATIATDYVKRSDHHAHVALWSAERVMTWSIIFDKGTRSRLQEEDVVSRIIINAFAEGCGLEERLELPLTPRDQLTSNAIDLGRAVDQLLSGEVSFAGVYADGRVKHEGINPEVLFPGSYNPAHEGHIGLADVAQQMLGKPTAFEISVFNVDKPPLPKELILSRLAQFAGRFPVYLTSAPTFIEKIRLFPETTFIVGYDTAARIIMPRYYDDSQEKMLVALKEIQDLGGRFLVAGRVDDEGEYHDAAGLGTPAEVADLFIPIPAQKFRKDISSSEIRAARKVKQAEG